MIDLIDYDIKRDQVIPFNVQATKTFVRYRLLSATFTKTESITWKKSALMMTLTLGLPKFFRAQAVDIVGGEGIVCGYTIEAGRWTYLIEMTLGPEPSCGRVGSETRVLMHESELHVRDENIILYEK